MRLKGEFNEKIRNQQRCRNGIARTAGMASTAQAADSVNVAFFLEWATPNQIAKVEKAYDEAMGVDVNWTDFSTGVQMTEAMLAGDIDIAYSQGLAPFVTAIQQGAPLKMVGIAVVYEANDCFVSNKLGISSSNASELEGKTVAVPLNTMADFSFRKQMAALDVDIDTMTIVDQVPADGAVSLPTVPSTWPASSVVLRPRRPAKSARRSCRPRRRATPASVPSTWSRLPSPLLARTPTLSAASWK